MMVQYINSQDPKPIDESDDVKEMFIVESLLSFYSLFYDSMLGAYSSAYW